MADKKTVDIPLPFGARLLLSFVKFSDKYFPLIAQQIILSQFYHPIRFTQNQNYPPIFKQAKEFDAKVAKGNLLTVPAKSKLIEYLAILPIPPPMKTQRKFI